MSQKSFAIASIFAALICGKFFYPNSPRRITPMAAPTSSDAPRTVAGHEASNRIIPRSTSPTDTKAKKVTHCDAATLITKSTPISCVAYGMAK
jgi:hypothetical protein